MAQRDYVRRGQPSTVRRKKPNSRKSAHPSLPNVSPMVIGIAAAVLVIFIGGLYFITHHKKEESEALTTQKVPGNGLPPKPEERWRYIKELEGRQPGVRTPTEPTAGGEITNQSQLTDEQRQLLEQMQADMRQQPTQLSEVPWNEQTAAQRQQTLQRQAQWNAQHPQNMASVPPVSQPRSMPQPAPAPQPRNVATAPAQQPRNVQQHKPAAQPPYQDLMQTPPKTAASKPAPVTEETSPKTADKADTRRWMIQCGSFRGAEQAETVRAKLAFEGFDSHITTNNGWNRVVIGPVKGKDAADGTMGRLKTAGHPNCIRLSAGG
ncbi:cell division protein FtsN [Shimwellia pseudoproteus]|uniref:cell division protein FtsN n=1 Tax=Shimwellia pseudoproteus TaxID=570012 RepID=UPI0018EDDBE2|nr:cell division protein FtsN [Shimwellia pseudoproteus]